MSKRKPDTITFTGKAANDLFKALSEPPGPLPVPQLVALAEDLVVKLNRSPPCTNMQPGPLNGGRKVACVARNEANASYFSEKRMRYLCDACLALWGVELAAERLRKIVQYAAEDEADNGRRP